MAGAGPAAVRDALSRPAGSQFRFRRFQVSQVLGIPVLAYVSGDHGPDAGRAADAAPGADPAERRPHPGRHAYYLVGGFVDVSLRHAPIITHR